MTKKIGQKIVGYTVATEEQTKEANIKVAESNIIQMHEKVSRPEALAGSTYKIKTPMSDHALYLTINDIILNEGTDHELRRPFEVFINSKNMDHFPVDCCSDTSNLSSIPQRRRLHLPG